MSKKVDIESGSFQIRFNLNPNLIWTQVGLLGLLTFMLIFVKNQKVINACWLFLVLDIASIIISFLIGMKMSVSDDNEASQAPAQQQVPQTPATPVGEKKISKESSTKKVDGTIRNKAPLPNPAAAQAPAQTTVQITVQQSPAPAAQATHQKPAETVKSADEPALGAEFEGKDVTELSDDDWAKLFGL